MPVMTTQKPLSIFNAAKKLTQKLERIDTQAFLSKRSQRIFRFELAVEKLDLLAWLENQQNSIKIFWEDREKCFTHAGIGAAHIINPGNKKSPYQIIPDIQQHLLGDFQNLKYFGGFCFDFTRKIEEQWKNFGAGRFVLPLIELNRTSSATTLACNILIDKNISGTIKTALAQLRNLQPPKMDPGMDLSVFSDRFNIPVEKAWKKSVEEVLKSIQKSRYKKIVLARRVRLKFYKPVNPFALMCRLRKSSSNCFCFIFQFKNGESFLGTSPERLYKRLGHQLQTEAIAGTRPQSPKTDENSFLINDLLSSPKDRKEQSFVSAMIKKRLEKLCETFLADENPSTLNWSAGHHLITRLSGQLKENISDKDILKALHPTPAVAGTPTKKALFEIHRIEKFDRGWYCGPVGYIGQNQSEFAVAIRSGLIENTDLYLYAGAGIIKESLPAEEWIETENKLLNFLEVFNAS